MSVPSWAWVLWLAGGAVGFAVLETWAIRSTQAGDTLSENVRRWLGVNPPRRGRRLSAAGFATSLLVFVAWFVPHILG